MRLLISAGRLKNDPQAKAKALSSALNDPEAFRMLLDYGADPGLVRPPILLDAASTASPEIIRTLLAHHIPVDARDGEGRTALLKISRSQEFEQKKSAERAAVVSMLIAAGTNVRAAEKASNTALHECEDERIAALLIKAGANANARNYEGRTPLMTTKNSEVAKLLLHAGADPQLQDVHGYRVIDLAQPNSPKHTRLQAAP